MRAYQARRQAGFTLAEILIVMATVTVIAGIAIFMFLSYLNTATLRGAADELATILGRGRQMAIAQNTRVCVEQTNDVVRYHVGPNACNEAAWVGTGTTADGSIALANTAQVSAATANVVFNRLGGADTTGTYTLTNPSTGHTTTVAVSSTGKVTVVAP